MQIDFAFQALEHLGKSHFNRTWPMESIRAIEPELSDISDKAMTATVKRARVDLSPSSFPSLRRILDLVKEEQRKINVANSPAEPFGRAQEDRYFQQKFGESANNYHKACANICIKIATGEMSDEAAVEACAAMEKKFPGVGWRDTQVFYIQRVREKTELKEGWR